ncbi:PfkB family carbohydrate kinase [Gudongella sp. DL1XJH-153]|uniref:PfkB family carbohydrate kinase n=1 Tax=Gudongella sp. DL1XJH-153 TaxID=3409804 RepID=UPI003BB5A123
MILSIDLNPVLNKWLDVDEKFEKSKSYMADITGKIPGDGGAYLTLILSLMNEQSKITGFSGGSTGEFIKNRLSDAGVFEFIVNIGEESPERTLLNFKDTKLDISQKYPCINRDEISEFYKELKEGLNTCEIICLSGEYPANMPDDMPLDIALLSREWGRKMLVAPKIEFLEGIVQEAPYLLLVTIEGLESLTNLKLEFEGDIIRACQYLFQNDIEYVVVDMKKMGLLLMNSEKGFGMKIEKESMANGVFMHSGILAGFATGMIRKYDFETTARLSFACGVLDYRSHKGKPDMTDIKSLMNSIDIRSFHNL